MKPTIQNRAARCITSALLGATLSEKELDEIADEFLHGGSLLRQIGQTIKEFLASTGRSSTSSKIVLAEDGVKPTGDPVIDEALAIIKKKRLSKANIMQKIGIIAPEMPNHFSSRIEMPVQDMLMELPRSSTVALLELLKGRTTKEDEYLTGIMREKR